MQTRPGIRYPSFFWQGLLIVLPAFLLAGIGLFSLRQDRLLAQVDAGNQAGKLVRDLVESGLPSAFHFEIQDLPTWQAPLLNRFLPADEPLVRGGPVPWVAYLADRSGALTYPPPLTLFPPPNPLPLEQLDEERQRAWQASQEVLFEGKDPVAAIEQLQVLEKEDLPDPFLALIDYQLGVLWQDAGNEVNARPYFERVMSSYPNAQADSGISLAVCAAQRLLQMNSAVPPGSRRSLELARFVAWHAIFEPTLWSIPTLEALPDNESWLNLWRIHEKARALHDYLQTLDEPPRPENLSEPFWRWAHWADDQDWLLSSQPVDSHMLWFALPENSVRTLVQKAIDAASAPPYLGLQVAVDGQPLPALANSQTVLADSSLLLPGAATNGITARFRVRVILTDADLLYARQRIRTRWFSALIGVSFLAVLAGLAAAWRAFRHQQELSEMKTNFVSSVSHELRAPIASVRLMAEELEDLGPANPQKNREYQRFIVQECRRLSGLVENVLDFARHEQGRKQYEFESTDLVALLQETARIMQTYAADRAIEVVTEIRGEAEPADADGQALQQVLVNLLDNAIKHSPPRSRVEAGLEFTAGRAIFWVQDHGEGIPAEDHQLIFERFYRRGSEMRRKTQGVGLGLAIVKYVTEAHGGTVEVKSALGQGSRFSVTLPLHRSENTKPL